MRRKTLEDFILQAEVKHCGRYDYSKVDYVNNTTKVEIICSKHGAFFQAPKKHVLGQGCQKCSGKMLKTTNEFISKASMLHKEKYNYSSVKYVNDNTKVEIICFNHGIFLQSPNKHLQGRGCPKCSSNISKASTEWLNNLNVPLREKSFKFTNERRKRQVDGYDPKTNTIYQFHGNYWHGNSKRYEPTDTHPIVKKTFGQLYEYTLRKDQNIRDSGYNLIVRWENET